MINLNFEQMKMIEGGLSWSWGKKLLIFLVMVLVFSCKKTSINVTPTTIPLKDTAKLPTTVTDIGMSNATKLTMRKDPDYVFIMTQEMVNTSKMVNSSTDLSKFDFTDQGKVLKLLNMTADEYKVESASMNSAAQRLIKRYRISGKCLSCQASITDRSKIYQSVFSGFQKDKVSFELFKNKLIPGNSIQVDTSIGPGCSNWVYVCILLCNAADVAPPIFLACAAICMHDYCSF